MRNTELACQAIYEQQMADSKVDHASRILHSSCLALSIQYISPLSIAYFISHYRLPLLFPRKLYFFSSSCFFIIQALASFASLSCFSLLSSGLYLDFSGISIPLWTAGREAIRSSHACDNTKWSNCWDISTRIRNGTRKGLEGYGTYLEFRELVEVFDTTPFPHSDPRPDYWYSTRVNRVRSAPTGNQTSFESIDLILPLTVHINNTILSLSSPHQILPLFSLRLNPILPFPSQPIFNNRIQPLSLINIPFNPIRYFLRCISIEMISLPLHRSYTTLTKRKPG